MSELKPSKGEIIIKEDVSLGEAVKEIRFAQYTDSIFLEQYDEMDGEPLLATIEIGSRQAKELRDLLTEFLNGPYNKAA